MTILGMMCYALAAVVIWSSVVQALRIRAAARRDGAWTAKAATRRKVRAIGRRVRCAACPELYPMEVMTDYGKDGDGKPSFLCPSCHKLLRRK